MKPHLLTLLCLALPMAVLPGCGANSFVAERQAIAQARFEVDHVVLRRADVPWVSPEAGADVEVVLKVTNPNAVTAKLDRLDYTLLVEGQPVGSGATTSDFQVPANGTALLALPVSIRYQGLPSVVLDALQQRAANITVRGVSHLATPLGRLDYPLEINHRATF
ncbi:MAG: LEA type 2 family protein [Candidatus Sericytochromatia bacterium]